jgi:hypothetical protein
MIKLTELLNEMAKLPNNKWVPLSTAEVKEVEVELLAQIKNAYKDIGGHPKFKTKSDIESSENHYIVIDVDNDNEIDALQVHKNTSHGEKSVASGHNGSPAARHAIVKQKVKALKSKGHYIEVSGRLKDILIAKGIHVVTDEDFVRKILAPKSIKWNGDGTYDRNIMGKIFTKTLMGKPR